MSDGLQGIGRQFVVDMTVQTQEGIKIINTLLYKI